MEVPKSLMTKKSKEDEHISAGLRLQAKRQQTSYIKRIQVFFFAI